jgi:hypothetical protein
MQSNKRSAKPAKEQTLERERERSDDTRGEEDAGYALPELQPPPTLYLHTAFVHVPYPRLG